MFQFFFKYPIPVFSKGQFVLLGSWPGWVLLLLIVASTAGLAVLIWSRLPQAAANIRKWRAGAGGRRSPMVTASLRGRGRRKKRSRTACWQDCKRNFRSGSTGSTAG